MGGTSIKALFCTVTVCLAALVLPPGICSAEPTEVRVNNFPNTQRVNGAVSLEGTAKAVKQEGILLLPSRRNELSELFHAGKVETDGYTSVAIHVQGEMKSDAFSSGTIGVILIPDEKPILRALKEVKQLQFPIETACSVKSGDSEYFSCESNQSIGFAQYRIYLYNTTNKSAEVNAYLYLRK